MKKYLTLKFSEHTFYIFSFTFGKEKRLIKQK